MPLLKTKTNGTMNQKRQEEGKRVTFISEKKN